MTLNGVTLRLVEGADAGFILQLRSDESLNTHISVTKNDIADQLKWIRNYKEREADALEFYFLILYQNEAVGTIRIYDIQGRSFCWGSWIIQRGNPVHVAIKSALLIYDYGFSVLKYDQSHFDVRVENTSVNKFHQRMGAELVKSDAVNNYYIMKKAVYLQQREQLLKFISR